MFWHSCKTCILSSKALKMPYFSNKPPPALGHQLPRPGSNKIVNKESEAHRPGIKRKMNPEQGGSLALLGAYSL